ncbi:MAG: hypothetical protein AAGD13_09690 [Pseudomonadota bacterium]
MLCDDCSKPLTACCSKSKTGKKHPYYLCPTKGCASYRKSIQRDVIEGALQRLEPSQYLFKLAKAMFNDAWNMRIAQAQENAKAMKGQINKADKQIEALLDRIVDAGTPSAITAYEQRISKLEREKALIEEKLRSETAPRYTLEESFELALRFLSSPWNIKKKADLILKKQYLDWPFWSHYPTAGNMVFEPQK